MSDTTALAVIAGTLPEKMQAYQMISKAAEAGMYGQYDTGPKVIAACWSADALQVHPVTFMQGVHVVSMKGRISMIPKWEFEHALLKARIPGYRFKVVTETAEKCVLWGTDGTDEHEVTYTIEDATRQGLVQRNPETWRANQKEMLFKQAYHRLADRVGAHVLAGMPSYLPLTAELNAEIAASGAEVQDAVDAAGAAPVPDKDWRKEFAGLARTNGYSAKRGLTQLINVLRREHGLAPIQWAQVEQIDQVTWKDYYERCAKRGWPKPTAETSAGPEPDAPPADTSSAEVLPDDVPPPDDAPDYGDAAEPPDPEGEALLNAYHDLEVAANRLTGVVGVTVLKEHPQGSGKRWVVFKPVLLAGTPLKVWEAGGPTLGVEQMQNLTKALDGEAQKRDRTR